MERKGKAKIKKLIAIFCIFAILQAYFTYFAQIAVAVGETVVGGSSETSDDVTVGSGENQENTDNETTGGETVVGGSSDNETENPNPTDGETTVGGNPFQQGDNDTPDETDPNGGSVIVEDPEEPTDEPDGEEPTEPTEENPDVENPDEEEPKDEEPYVEPEATIEVTSQNSSIYKGYLYANATSDMGYETNYNTVDVVSIVGGKNLASLTVQDEPDKIGLITNRKFDLGENTYYRQTRIAIQEFNTILGKDGSITVYAPNGDVIGTISKDTTVVGEEYVFVYPAEYNFVRFELKGIRNDGTISFKNDKVIKSTAEFQRNEISLFTTINTLATVSLYEEGKEVKNYTSEGNINLEETESKMLIDADTTTLAVEGKNEVAINVTLKTDEERYDLFENPTINIEFPSAIKELNVTGVSLLYKNGLSIDNWNVTTNSIGKKVLRVNLSGAQSEYMPGSVNEGTTLVLNTEIDVDRLTADSKDVLKLTYTNKDTVRKAYVLEGKDSEDIEVGFVGRQELVRSMAITEPDVATATSYDAETEKIQILTNQNQTIYINGAIVNNYEATLEDVVIIGRIPFVGNKDGNGNDLGTNFNTTLQSALATSGVVGDVYYSEDGNANASSDTWTQDTTNLSSFKSFKIVVREKTLAKGERISFDYNLTVPESVGYNAIGYTNYTVYYKIDTQNYSNQCSVGMYTEIKEVDMDDIEEEHKEELNDVTVGTQVSQGGKTLGETDSVYERQVIKYTVVVKNTSNNTLTNILVKGKAENANLYDWEYISTGETYFQGVDQVKQMKEYTQDEKEYVEFTIDSLAPGTSKTIEFQAIVKDLSEIDTPEVYGKIIVSNDSNAEKEVTTFKNEVKEANLEVLIKKVGTELVDEEKNITNDSIGLYSYIKNITDHDLENVKYTLTLPDSVTLFDKMIICNPDNVEYTVNKVGDGTTIVVFNIPKIEAGEHIGITYYIKNNSMDYNVYSTKMTITSFAEIDDEVNYSNDYSKKIYQSETKVEYKLLTDTDKEYVDNGDVIKFTLNAKNIGFNDSGLIQAIANIPSGLEITDLSLDDVKESSNNIIEEDKIKSNLQVDEGKEQNLTITAKVNKRLYARDQKTIEFSMDIKENSEETIKTNIISYKIENSNITQYSQPETNNQNNNQTNNNQSNNNQPTTPSTPQPQTPTTTPEPTVTPNNVVEQVPTGYNITGLAWVDENQDGIRQDEEQLKEAVVVSLYKANKYGGIDTSSLVATTSTNSQGKYTFTNVAIGKYIVVFDYNASKYKVTKYQSQNATTVEDSDAISKTVTINGVAQTVGVTDVLEITDSGFMAIDIGIVDKTNFDLKLEKMISQIRVKNDEGTKYYDYRDMQNGRLEIRSKYYKSSVVNITYKFRITNEGDVPGYVNKVVDYLPSGVQVVLNKSEGWYVGSDNGLYYTGLVDQEIAPGETKEFTLMLRRSLEEGESAILTNGAEIAETTNALGLFDRDSIENNKMKSEDDYSESTLIITVATGHTVEYITMTLVIIIMVTAIIAIAIKIKTTKRFYR